MTVVIRQRDVDYLQQDVGQFSGRNRSPEPAPAALHGQFYFGQASALCCLRTVLSAIAASGKAVPDLTLHF